MNVKSITSFYIPECSEELRDKISNLIASETGRPFDNLKSYGYSLDLETFKMIEAAILSNGEEIVSILIEDHYHPNFDCIELCFIGKNNQLLDLDDYIDSNIADKIKSMLYASRELLHCWDWKELSEKILIEPDTYQYIKKQGYRIDYGEDNDD